MRTYQRGDVVIINTPITKTGHVQGGTRPYVIVQNNMGNKYSPTTIVCPMTSKLKRTEMSTHVVITWDSIKNTMVQCEQVRVMDVSPDWKYVTTLPKEIMASVDAALMNAFFYEPEVNDHAV